VGYINHLWYMGALVCIYVFFPLIKTAYDHNRGAFLFFSWFTFLLTFFNTFLGDTILFFMQLNDPASELIDSNLFNFFNPFREIYGWTFVYFCFGGVFKEKIEKIKAHRLRSNLLAVFAFAASVSVLFAWGCYKTGKAGVLWEVVFLGYGTIPALIATTALCVLSLNYRSKSETPGRIVLAISNNTLGIYFVHYLLIYATRKYYQQFEFVKNLIGDWIYAAFILTVSLLIVLVVRRIPILRYLVAVNFRSGKKKG